jgi:hypothetical protein
MPDLDLLEEPPVAETVTDYDIQQKITYLRLLDAAREGADWRDAVAIIFGIDPSDDPARARRIHDSHLARARWMSKEGYRCLLKDAPST